MMGKSFNKQYADQVLATAMMNEEPRAACVRVTVTALRPSMLSLIGMLRHHNWWHYGTWEQSTHAPCSGQVLATKLYNLRRALKYSFATTAPPPLTALSYPYRLYTLLAAACPSGYARMQEDAVATEGSPDVRKPQLASYQA